MRREKSNCLTRRHLQHIVNIFILITYIQHGALIERPAALLANQFHVRKTPHPPRTSPVALACPATPARNVERKMSRRKSALLCLGRGRKYFAYRIERLQISRRIRPRSPPNRRLV